MPETTASAVQIRMPREGEWPACRMLLPETLRDASLRDYWLAVEERPLAFLGAISCVDDGEALTGLRLHAVPGEQRSRVEAMLLNALADEASRRGRIRLATWTSASRDAALAEVLLRNGFAISSRFFTVEGELSHLVRYFAERRRGAVPCPGRDVQVVPLTERFLKAAGRLFAQYIASVPEPLAARAYWSGDLDRLGLSRVLLVEGKVAGLSLVEWFGGQPAPDGRPGNTALVRARIVIQGYRGSRASALLAETTVTDMRQAGIERLRFQFFDKVRDTAKIARRVNADILECANLLTLHVPPSRDSALAAPDCI